MNQSFAGRTDPQTARAYWTMGRGDSERAFRAARDHSRVVRILRIAVPASVVLIFAALFLVTWLNPLRLLDQLPASVGDLVVSGSTITMQQPRLAGFTRDARAYELTAAAAAQDFTRPDIVKLSNIRAKVQMQDNSMMEMTAVNGVYDTKGEMLTLGENIVLSSSTGYQGRLSEAVVDIRKGHIVSNKPVELKMLQGTLNANQLEVVNSGELVRFEGGVTMMLMLTEEAKQNSERSAQPNSPPPQAGAREAGAQK